MCRGKRRPDMNTSAGGATTVDARKRRRRATALARWLRRPDSTRDQNSKSLNAVANTLTNPEQPASLVWLPWISNRGSRYGRHNCGRLRSPAWISCDVTCCVSLCACRLRTRRALHDRGALLRCSSERKASAANHMVSVESMCKTLDIKLNEIPDWNCCGASIGYAEGGELPRHIMNARNIAFSEQHNPAPRKPKNASAIPDSCWRT